MLEFQHASLFISHAVQILVTNIFSPDTLPGTDRVKTFALYMQVFEQLAVENVTLIFGEVVILYTQMTVEQPKKSISHSLAAGALLVCLKRSLISN